MAKLALRSIRVAGATLLVGALIAVTYRTVLEGQVLAGREIFRLFIPDNALLLDYIDRFDWPLWNPYVRMGQPFAATIQAQVFYPPRVLTVWFLGPVVSMTAMQVLHVVLAIAGVVWLLTPLLHRWYAPWAAGVFFALSPMFSDLAMQQNVVDTAAWSGFLLGALYRREWRSFAASLAMSLLAGSPETSLWQLFLCGVLAWRLRQFRVRALAAGLVGFALAAPMLVPAAEFTRHSIRGADGVNSGTWSMSWQQLVASFWPAFDLPSPEYWGDDQHFVANVFLGAAVVGLGCWGALRGPAAARALSWGGGALLLFSMGRHVPLIRSLLLVPPFSFFRYPAKAYVGVAFCAAVLAAFGIDAAARAARRFHPRRAWLSAALLGIVAIACCVSWLLPSLPVRAGAVMGAPWPWFVAASVVLSLLMLPEGRVRGPLFAATVTTLAVLELVLARWLLVVPEYRPVGTLTQVMGAPLLPEQHGRVSAGVLAFPETFHPAAGDSITWSRTLLVPNRFMEARVETVNGYGAPEPARFERLEELGSRGFFDLSGVSHYLSENGVAPFPDLTKLKEVAPGIGLYESHTALPRAFVVQRSVEVGDDEALRAIEDESAGQPFRHTAFLAEGPTREGAPCESQVTREASGLREAAYRVEACGDGFLVMTDSFFPGWHAQVDGVDTRMLRADYVFRAVEISRGHHRVALRYWPASFSVGVVLMFLALGALPWRWWNRT